MLTPTAGYLAWPPCLSLVDLTIIDNDWIIRKIGADDAASLGPTHPSLPPIPLPYNNALLCFKKLKENRKKHFYRRNYSSTSKMKF